MDIEKKDLRIRPVKGEPGPFKLTLPHEPYRDQVQAALSVKNVERGIITAPTGVGKSVIAALIINHLQVNTLVVVPSLELKRQLTNTLSQCFGEKHVGGIGKRIAVENIDSLEKKNYEGLYDCVIIDEFHHSGAETYRTLNKNHWNKIYYKYGLTATPFRSRDHERLLMESVLSRVIYRIDYKTAVENNYIVPIEAYYFELPKTVPVGYTWPEIYRELVVENEFRNNVISQLIQHLRYNNQSVLTLVKEIQHGKMLGELSTTHFASGQTEDSDVLIKAFSLDKIKQLIGTTGVLGEGVDTKPAEYIIIAGLGKSKNAFMQQVGRGFRKFNDKQSCKVILFKDNSHKWTKSHFREQCKILFDEYGVKPVKLEL